LVPAQILESMIFLPVPKILKWDWNLSQQYSSERSILITSGCSFTSSTMDLSCASSWPGYMRDRCRFDRTEDWSYPGAGNFYISQSIIEAIKRKSDAEKNQCFVAVMWSGLDRLEYVTTTNQQPILESGSYQRTKINTLTKSRQAMISYDYIKSTQEILEKYNVPYAFTFYMNLLLPPFIPARDNTHQFYNHVDNSILDHLVNLHTLSSGQDCLYDFSFYNNYIEQSVDQYHPIDKCTLDWTDRIWLPALARQGLICST